MNVTVETLAPCKKLVRVEVDAQTVNAAIELMTKNFQRESSLPGFRPGKAPRDMILKRYEKGILEEAKRKLVGDNYQQAIKEQKLEVVGAPDIEEIQFGRDQALQFAATVEIAPQFELPEYKGVVAKRETTTVTEADVDRALDMLRGREPQFEVVDRPVQTGDIAVVNYSGTVDGKPISEIAPAVRGLSEKKGFWVEMQPGQFVPGFTEQLQGMKVGEKRTVNVDFPADFVSQQLGGKKGVYEVELTEVRQKLLPALDEAFAKKLGADDVTKLREGVRKDLENDVEYRKTTSVRNQVIQSLLARITCDLPEVSVNHETKNVVYDIVGENQRRGISKEVIEKQKDQIYSVANASARERVKAAFLFQRIAEKENIKVTEEEILRRIYITAAQYNMSADKFLKELQKRDGVGEMAHQTLATKVVDFLVANAKIEDVAPQESAEQPATPAPQA